MVFLIILLHNHSLLPIKFTIECITNYFFYAVFYIFFCFISICFDRLAILFI